MLSGSYYGYWLIVFGVAIVGLMINVNGIVINETQDSYAIREIVDASMMESVDWGYYRDYNELKINKEKFMEIFIRRMAFANRNSLGTYEISFYAIYEAPPKVSVEVRSNSGTNFINTNDYDTTTRISAIIQTFADTVDES